MPLARRTLRPRPTHHLSHNRFTRWSRRGVWQRMFKRMAAAGPALDELSLDIKPLVRHRSENRRRGHVKAHRSAQGSKRGAWPEAVGLSRGGTMTKIRGLADPQDRPHAFALTPGNTPDIHMAIPLLEGLPRPKRLIADKAYDAMSLRRWLKKRRIRAVIPSLATQTFLFLLDRKAYRRRNVIECLWEQLKKWRRIATQPMTASPATTWPGWRWPPL